MVAAQFLKTRISTETKRLVQAAAGEQSITESTWLTRLVVAALRASSASSKGALAKTEDNAHAARGARLYVRLRHEDRLLLRERANARGLRLATYVSVLLRAHLRELAPLPKEELVALKRSVAELNAIGRNLNQIARAANQGRQVIGPRREDLHAFLNLCEALRDNVKAVIKSNLTSWEVGYADLES
ncbi:MAG: plasmid mobilization relaxosome protein MobC [Steroidobacteraceae bacterium]